MPRASGTPEGLALVNKVHEFIGGKAKIDAIKAVRLVGTMSVKTSTGQTEVQFDDLLQYPDMRRIVMKAPIGEMTMVSTHDGGFMSGPMGTQDMPASQREKQQHESKIDLLTVLRNIDNPKYIFTASGPDTLEINADGVMAKWIVDPAVGRVLRRSSQADELVHEYTEWKSFDGINLPVAYNLTSGKDAGGVKVSTVEINPTVDPKTFVKPQQ
jgi:hypothetical protein